MQCKKLIPVGLFMVLFSLLFLFSCNGMKPVTPGKVEDGWNLFNEIPSLELSLDRLNTAGGALRLVDVIIKDMAISDTAKWPEQMTEDPVGEMAYLDLDGMYASHCGKVPGGKKHIISVLESLYTLPPDNYALAKDYYGPGEETIINGKYIKVISHDSIIKKQPFSEQELKSAVDSVKKSILIKKSVGIIEKRTGILKANQISGQRYSNLMEAVCSLSPNGEAIYDAFENRDAAKEQYNELIEELRELQKKGTGEENEEQLSILGETLERVEKELEDKNHILVEELDNIDQYRGSVDDPVSVLVLMNVSKACEGTSALLDDALFLTGQALVQMGLWINNGSDLSAELERIQNPYEQGRCRGLFGRLIEDIGSRFSGTLPPAIFTGIVNQNTQRDRIQAIRAYYDTCLPLRISRLQGNFFNSLDSLNAIKVLITEDRKLMNKIDEKAKLLMNPDVAAGIENGAKVVPSIQPRPAAVKVDLVREIQQALTNLGYAPGPIDGQFGRRTAQAIKQFQNDFGYPENGRATIEFLRIAAHTLDLQTQGVDIKKYPQQIRQFFKTVQKSLKNLGYYSGAIDGRPGQEICTAANNFLNQGSASDTCNADNQELEQVRQMGGLCRFVE